MRKAWIPYFDKNLSAIIFITALSGYDQTLLEDSEKNRMIDAIELFTDIANNAVMCKNPIILLLNKMDVFEEKILRSQIADYFPEFTQNQSVSSGKAFFRGKFESVIKGTSRKTYIHFTMNTDQKLTKFVIEAVFKIVLDSNLSYLS